MSDVIPLIIKSAKSAVETIKNSSSRAKKSIFAVVAVIAIVLSLSFTGARIAYKVSYSGHTIATVGSKKQFDDALLLVADMVEGEDINAVVEEPVFSTAIVLNENIDNTADVANAIIDNTYAIVKASVLKVNGKVVAKADKDMLDGAIAEHLNSFNIDGAECTSHFVEELSFEEGYFMECDLAGKTTVQEILNSLSVVTEARQITDIIVPYETIVQKTNEQVIGYSAVTVKGVSGLTRVTDDIVMLNGKVTSTTNVDTQIVVAAVDEVIVKGTAKTLASAKQKQQAHAAGFIFPLPSGTWRVSSYWGDGRNHKGVDLCAKSGTSIYAVLDGTVVRAGWYGDYGYCVIIEHDNGMRTLYAHARQVCCSVGDRVSQGDVIALVGTTGQSTGNHLHFEVSVDGKKVDPAPYINLD